MSMSWPLAPEAPGPHGRLIGYARVSTSDQKLDLQRNALTRAGCHAIYEDHGWSGGVADRPGLEDALMTLCDGDVLVVYKLDRLGRSVLHLADLLTRLDNQGIHFCSLTEGINTTTPGGKLVYHVFAAVAEFTRDMIRENTLYGLQAAKERGVTLGRPRLMDDLIIIEAHRYMRQEARSLNETAERYEVSPRTLLRGFERLGLG